MVAVRCSVLRETIVVAASVMLAQIMLVVVEIGVVIQYVMHIVMISMSIVDMIVIRGF